MQLFSGRHGEPPSPTFIDADPVVFRAVLDFLRAAKNCVPPPDVSEQMVPSVLATARSFGLTRLVDSLRLHGGRCLPYAMVVQFYLGHKLSFAGMDLHGYSFRGWDLHGAHFSHADLAGCDFSHAVLNSVPFKGANLAGCDFSHARWSGANAFMGADLSGCIFTDDVQGDFTDATLVGCVGFHHLVSTASVWAHAIRASSV